jgi:hypothetical protein
MTDISKTTDKVIAYNREVIDVICNNNDILINIPDTNTITKKCRKFIQNKETDPNKDPCPFGSELYNGNTCVGIGSNYLPVCEQGYDKIDDKCYKSCNDEYITVNINKVNGFNKKDDGSKCVSDLIIF